MHWFVPIFGTSLGNFPYFDASIRSLTVNSGSRNIGNVCKFASQHLLLLSALNLQPDAHSGLPYRCIHHPRRICASSKHCSSLPRWSTPATSRPVHVQSPRSRLGKFAPRFHRPCNVPDPCDFLQIRRKDTNKPQISDKSVSGESNISAFVTLKGRILFKIREMRRQVRDVRWLGHLNRRDFSFSSLDAF